MQHFSTEQGVGRAAGAIVKDYWWRGFLLAVELAQKAGRARQQTKITRQLAQQRSSSNGNVFPLKV